MYVRQHEPQIHYQMRAKIVNELVKGARRQISGVASYLSYKCGETFHFFQNNLIFLKQKMAASVVGLPRIS